MFRRIARVLCVLLMSTAAVSGGSVAAQSGYPSNRASISIGPNNASGSPGQVVSFHVGVSAQSSNVLRPSYSGSVLVTVPVGLTVVGSPACGSGCRKVFIEDDADGGSKLEASIDIYDGESASFSFQVLINSSAKVGSTYSLWAYLLGSFVSTPSWTSVATLTVVDSDTAMGPDAATSMPDNRKTYVSITPESLRIAPGGSALYFIRPTFWGMWETQSPEYSMEVRLPDGIELLEEPICAPQQAVMPGVSTCEVKTDHLAAGTTVITSHSNWGEPSPTALYLMVLAASDSPEGALKGIEASVQVAGDVPPAAARAISAANVLIVDPSELSLPSGVSGVAGQIELRSSFTKQGAACITNHLNAGTELALYEQIYSPILSRTSVSQGRLGRASDGSGSEVCILDFEFENAPKRTLYVVTTMPNSGDVPCRACVLGLLTAPGKQSTQVFVRGLAQ